MRINFDRLSKLAGLPSSGGRRSLNENTYHEADEPQDEGSLYEEEAPMPFGMNELDDADEGAAHHYEGEGHYEGEEAADDANEVMLEVDETMLVQELRRMKNLMNESKRRKRLAESRKRQRKQALYEAQLKRVIDEEVQNVLADMNYNSGWVYGDNRPTRSRHGYSHQGSYISGPGFRR